ncbi:hypothetical protein [Eleftheria terrae]|uniref:hypothetical protein n=1 Tax=Eleftheria terrae TaxID=1597781 RepID=UPI00263B327D|nr:hypothetical protein [Eleftheria terrae]WKB50763.1 hypothetical protein N7L95_13145 [Eleftheria terrae]
MINGEESTSRIERFHELAALGEKGLEALYSEKLKTWFFDFLASELPETPQPPVNSSKDLAAAINQLAQNKRAWAQRLGGLVIGLHDSQTQEQAALELRQFMQQCPWRYLRDSARSKL